jgi:ATP-dependent helicase HrpA
LALLPSPLPYPADLPITTRKDEILAAIAANQVVIVAGETGSGKSTQLPKICLEGGCGRAGMIGHTQPRRIAARSVGERVADELGVTFGGPVGYKVRFTDRVSDKTLVKLMTDGVLLAELHGDRSLRAYDALIIDEAHERSLNIDFILGYLKRLLPARPDLKVVITSATIDTERFSRHFGSAPVVEVSGRAYPVEIWYRPLGTDEDGGDEADLADPGGVAGGADSPGPRPAPGGRGAGGPVRGASGDGPSGRAAVAGSADDAVDEVQAVCDAVGELCAQGPGDILVFLAGERQIRDTADALGKVGFPGLEILPLYGRLSSSEQHRIFEAHAGRRVVLATNVAETSLTVPGIRYVVDPGTARLSRYSRRTKVQRLPIEPVSQASANQRAGRCGRLGPGICVRLYSEESFAGRRPFTEPEILRTNLASVVLQMAAIGLGEIEDFPFVEPPDRRNVKDGITLLEELGALVPPAGTAEGAGPAERGPSAGGRGWRLTGIGRKLAKLPLDPRLGRMVLEAERLGCLSDVLVIASAISVQDPRERPAEKKEAAAALHSRFDDGGSDFMSYLALWDYLGEHKGELTSSQFRKLCQREMISYQRSREWQDVHGQLAEICRQIGLSPGPRVPGRLDEARRALVHQALLAGLATQVGVREGERTDFAAPRGARFAIWPGSVLAKKPPRWVMAAELVETGRLWARVAAPIRPQWVEHAAAHLLKWSYGDPTWDAERAEGVVQARATLYGLPVVAGRRLELDRLDRELARDMFVRYALVEGDWDGAPAFVAANLEELQRLRGLLQRARRHDLMVGDEALFEFYDCRVGEGVTSGRSFAAWWRRQHAAQPGLLRARPEDLTGPGTVDVDAAGFPDAWSSPDEEALPLSYNWEPGSEDDGVLVEVPLARLAEVAGEGLEWQVPGLREELVVALLRSLPKDLRRHLVPVPEHARDFVAKSGPADGPLLAVLGRAMTSVAGVRISPGDFDWGKVPGYLRPTFSVIGEGGQVLARGKQAADILDQLRPQLEGALQAASSPAAPSAALGWGPPGRRATTWDFGRLPSSFEPEWHGHRLQGFPALVDEGEAVSVQVFSDEPASRLAMAAGTRRLLLLNLPAGRHLVDLLEHQLGNRTRLSLGALQGLSYPSPRELVQDAIEAAVDQAVVANGGPAWSPEGFEALVRAVGDDVEAGARQAVASAARIISKMAELRRRTEQLWATLASPPAPSPMRSALEDAASQLAALAGPRLVSRAGIGRLPDIERYLTALERRLEKLPADPRRDLAFTQRVQAVQQRLDEAAGLAAQWAQPRPPGTGGGVVHELDELRWMIEELRVSFFAQSLRTKVPVSEERIIRAIDRALAGE